MNFRKTYDIASVLVKSQLRSGRSSSLGARLFSNSLIILAVDVIIFVGSLGIVYVILGAIGTLPTEMETLLNTLTLQAVMSLPAFISLGVFIAAIMFELSVSSKFASSDVVNWLPVSQTEYVAASTLSVSYMYSFLPALVLGITYPLAARVGLQGAWGLAALLCVVTLFGVGALVEIIRAALNRVTSMVYGRARRGTVVIRLAITVIVILVIELAFNPVILSSLIGTFTGVINATFFVPVFWPSASIAYLIQGEWATSAAFFGLSCLFAVAVLFAAVKVRAMYWSPVPVTIEVTEAVYAPRAGGFLRSVGLSEIEAALVRKDVKGYTRRRELMPTLALPFVFVALLVVQQMTLSGLSATASGTTVYPFWLIGAILTVILASMCVGTEGKAILNVYAAPVTPRAFLKAKLFLAFVIGAASVVALALSSSILESASPLGYTLALAVSLVIAAECAFIGVGIATRYADLVDRPRPRFVRPLGMLGAMVLGVVASFVTAFPLVIWPFFGGFGVPFGVAMGGGFVFGGLVSFGAYRWALSGASRLMAEITV